MARHWWSKPKGGGKTSNIPSERSVSPEQNAGFFSILWFLWLNPIMNVGHKRHIERNDIWIISKNRTTDKLELQLHECFKKRIIARSRLALVWALYETFKFDFWIGALCQFIVSTFQVVAPFTLRFLLQWVQAAHFNKGKARGSNSIGVGLGYVIGIAVMQLLQVVASSQFYYRSMLFGGKARSTLIALSFGKALKLSNRAKAGGEPGTLPSGIYGDIPWRAEPKGWSNGRIMNIISNDTARIEQAIASFHLTWLSVYQLALTIALLVYNLGWTALTGTATLIVGLTAVTFATRPLVASRMRINQFTDRRVTLTQEMLQGIRFVKYFGWEAYFLDHLKHIRATEAGALQRMHLIRCGVGTLAQFLPVLGIMVTFSVYAVVYGSLDPAVIFSSLAIFMLLRTPTNWLPISIGLVADAVESLKRIESFLLAEEAPRQSVLDPDSVYAVKLVDASFTWEHVSTKKDPEESNDVKMSPADPSSIEKPNTSVTGKENAEKPQPQDAIDDSYFSLKKFSLEYGPGELVGVVGSVGSGKSSLLAALAGDMRQTEGEMRFSAKRAYCPQHAWIQNASVRDNIVFGKQFDKQRYADVIHACALQPDLDALPHGDSTEIGERGVTLSGGQKQRINIARAIFCDADIVLLDDPLSAVDAHVGTHIFNQAICGLMRNKCRILATHHLHLLSRFDKIIWMVEGRVAAEGTFTDLMERNSDFRSLLETMGQRHYKDDNLNEKDGELDYESGSVVGEDPIAATGDTKVLIQDEVKATDSVPLHVYVEWLRASGTLWNGLVILITHATFRASSIVGGLWLSWWVDDKFHLLRNQYIGLYAGICLLQGVLVFSASLITCLICIQSSKVMSNDALWSTLRAPISLFDTTPLGRIIYRFTRDIDALDNNLVVAVQQLMINTLGLLGSYVLIVAYYYYFVIALVFSVCIIAWCISYYRSSARELRRHHLVLDGAVFARFNEALIGAASIRAYDRQPQFVKRVHDAIDDMNGANFLTFASHNWLSVRLDNISIFLSLITGLLVVTNALPVSPSVSGLLMTYSMSMVGLMQIVVKYLIEVNNSMSNTERLYQYTKTLEQEAPLEGDPVRDSWPEEGSIKYEAVQMRYRPELPLAIDGFSLNINGGERIAIVGRTGAGKSTVLSTLFRLTEISGGRITIDGVDIRNIGLERLRSCLAIIPQDPTLFQGTIRTNLDPFEKHSDAEMWTALRKAHLLPKDLSAESSTKQADRLSAEKVIQSRDNSIREVTAELRKASDTHDPPMSLDARVEAEGLNFSLGQRQLLALARALLRDARIVLVDEGTSSVDPETDARVQQTLATSLTGKTLVAIAHRLHTVIQYDRICVMDKGRLAEIGTPLDLWHKGELFRSMCESNGITLEMFLQPREIE